MAYVQGLVHREYIRAGSFRSSPRDFAGPGAGASGRRVTIPGHLSI